MQSYLHPISLELYIVPQHKTIRIKVVWYRTRSNEIYWREINLAMKNLDNLEMMYLEQLFMIE
jgi:hypothetical protein